MKFGCEARHQNTLVNYVGNLITLHEYQMEGFIKFPTSGLFYGNFYSDIKHISSRSETVIPNVLGCVECVAIVQNKSYLTLCSISALYFIFAQIC